MDTYEGDQEDPQSLHKYVYVSDDPVDGIDPSGNDGDFDSSFDSSFDGFSIGGLGAQIEKLASSVATSPAKVKIVRNDGVKLGDYGAVTWDVDYALDTASPSGGWVIQKVKEKWDVKGSGGNPTPTGKWPNPGGQTYWEAWRVFPTTSVVFDMPDEFQNGPYPFSGTGTFGSMKWIGEVRFYEGLTLPKTFIMNNEATGAGDIPSTIIDPHLTNGGPPLHHILEVHWNLPGPKGSGVKTILDRVVPGK
jgi:hypothetical protein